MGKKTIKCDYCDKPAELVKGDVIYPKHPKLHKRWFWRCSPCSAYVGTHKSSKWHEPYGRLANSRLRFLKSRTHDAFDPLWKSRIPQKTPGARENNIQSYAQTLRHATYIWLGRQLDIPTAQCHIGMFDEDLCNKAIRICNTERLKQKRPEQ